jgi:hypothetical protein
VPWTGWWSSSVNRKKLSLPFRLGWVLLGATCGFWALVALASVSGRSAPGRYVSVQRLTKRALIPFDTVTCAEDPIYSERAGRKRRARAPPHRAAA